MLICLPASACVYVSPCAVEAYLPRIDEREGIDLDLHDTRGGCTACAADTASCKRVLHVVRLMHLRLYCFLPAQPAACIARLCAAAQCRQGAHLAPQVLAQLWLRQSLLPLRELPPLAARLAGGAGAVVRRADSGWGAGTAGSATHAGLTHAPHIAAVPLLPSLPHLSLQVKAKQVLAFYQMPSGAYVSLPACPPHMLACAACASLSTGRPACQGPPLQPR
jgi:hypothetical protein